MGNGNSHHDHESGPSRGILKLGRSQHSKLRNGASKVSQVNNKSWDSKDSVINNIKVLLEVYRNPQPTRVDEKNDKVVVFRTPTMRLKATVTVPPVPTGQIWTIGWVQSCHFMNFVNVYGHLGFTSWEFPQLNMRLAGVNDSDGESYPFYGHEKEICQLHGPLPRETTFVVSMSDSPASHVTLRVPSKHGSNDGIDLTNIHRKQKFTSWLVAFNDVSAECIELKCLDWDLNVAMNIDRLSPCGSRVSLLEPKEQTRPVVNVRLPRIPQCAKSPPDANHAQMLVFRPHTSKENLHQVGIIVAPQVRGHTTPTERELKNDQVYELAKQCLSVK